MLGRLGTSVYEACRTNRLSLAGFPDFKPTLDALKRGAPSERTKSYRVSCQQVDRLPVLQSFAQRWLEDVSTKERATTIITKHNEEYNASGEFWVSDRTKPTCKLKMSEEKCFFYYAFSHSLSALLF